MQREVMAWCLPENDKNYLPEFSALDYIFYFYLSQR